MPPCSTPPARPRDPVAAGDRITVRPPPAVPSVLEPQAVPFTVCHADADVLVIDKPPGVVVHPGAGNRDRTLVNGLIERYPELAHLPRAGLVHRIEKDTSGLLLVARHAASLQVLVRALAARRSSRRYRAVVCGVPVAGGTVDAPIGRDPQQRTRMRVTPGGRAAVTHYRVAARYRAHSLLDVTLETGRTHQIRVHMAWLGHPLVGDTRYGGRPRPPAGASPALRDALAAFPRQALHAAALSFAHPLRGVEVHVESALPDDLARLLEVLAADAAT